MNACTSELHAVPHAKSWIPYLGHGIKFATDADKMLAELQRQHGDEFSVVMGGKKITFILNPHDYGDFLKQAKTLRADELSQEVSAKAFGINWEEYDVGVHEMTAQFDKTLRRNKLGELTQSMHQKLEQRLHAQASHQWQEAKLFQFIAKLVFEAGGEALLGDGIFDDEKLFEEFLHFDKQFPMIISGLPRWMFFRRSDRYLKNLYKLLSKPNPNQSKVMDERFTFMDNICTRDAQGRINAGLFWATQANTVVMAFYSIFLILRNEEARGHLTQEVNDILNAVEEKTEFGTPKMDLDTIEAMKQLDAALDEVLRLKTASMPIRMATADVELPLRSGRMLRLKAGEYAALYPRTTHMNSEIYNQPDDFIWDRFLGKQGPNKFSYRDEPLKYNFLPFGGGLSICPGRHFAKNEFKVLTAALLHEFDIELIDSAMPEHDNSRAGLGALTPLTDIRFRYRLRASQESAAPTEQSAVTQA